MTDRDNMLQIGRVVLAAGALVTIATPLVVITAMLVHIQRDVGDLKQSAAYGWTVSHQVQFEHLLGERNPQIDVPSTLEVVKTVRESHKAR
ncbi:MAG: hypothetical protein ACOCTI_04385 [Phycisphaeraceae bacterium]